MLLVFPLLALKIKIYLFRVIIIYILKNDDGFMIDILLPKSVKLISPRLTVLVNTVDDEGELNSSPYSWIFPLSFNPPLIGVGIGGKHKLSYVNSKKTGEFVVCVVSEDFGQKAVSCEKSHKPGDKLWEKNGLHTQKSQKVKVPRIKEAKAVLECKVTRFLEYDGDHIILVGKVVHAEAEEGGLDKIKPLLHDSGEKFRMVSEEIVLKRGE
jgi:flavin reductase (DIM6/NTAB) family NADH-FMN oxidoreductase RutF